jgi:uncharacterized membrane protein (DUF106 family)
MFESITGALVGAFDVVFSPIMVLSPMASLFVVSAILTLVVVGLNRALVNKDVAKQLKDRMEEIREKLTQAQKIGNTEEANRFLSELMDINSSYMKQSFKVLIASTVVLLLVLPWMQYKYTGSAVAALPFDAPFIGSGLSWVLWYVLVSFTIGWVVRKLLGLE